MTQAPPAASSSAPVDSDVGKEQKGSKVQTKRKNPPATKNRKSTNKKQKKPKTTKKKKPKNAPRTVLERIQQLEQPLLWNPSISVRNRARLGIQRVQPVLRNTLTQKEMHKGGVRAGFSTTDPDELHLDDQVLLTSTEALGSYTEREVQGFKASVASLRERAFKQDVNKVPEVQVVVHAT
jgi:hypothetical protein